MATAKIYYNRIVRVKETKNYIFIYNTRVTALSVDKSKLPLNELNTIRILLGRPIVGEAPTVIPAPQAPAEQTATEEVKPEESVEEVKTEENVEEVKPYAEESVVAEDQPKEE